MKAKTTKKKVAVRKPKPRVATREQRVGAMFEKANDAYNKLMDTHLKLVERYNELLEQNTSLRIQVYRLELLSGTVLDEPSLKDSDWDSMIDSVVGNPVSQALKVDDEIYGKQARPVNQQRTTNDLYRVAKDKYNAQYQERLEQYAEQEEVIAKAVAEAKVSAKPIEVQLSAAKQQYYVEAGKTAMGID